MNYNLFRASGVSPKRISLISVSELMQSRVGEHMTCEELMDRVVQHKLWAVGFES